MNWKAVAEMKVWNQQEHMGRTHYRVPSTPVTPALRRLKQEVQGQVIW